MKKYSLKIIATLVALATIASCKKDQTNIPPIAEFTVGSEIVKTGELLVLTESSYDVDGNILDWQWEYGDGRTSKEQEPSVAYNKEGVYELALTVVDNHGEAGSTSTSITVENENVAPALAFTITGARVIDGNKYDVGSTLVFEDQSTDEDGEIAKSIWTISENSIESSKIEKTFNLLGEVEVSLTVEDNEGLTSDTSFVLNFSGLELEPWQPGWLDIHHINTGRGDATFLVFPDGTNMLFDAGNKYMPGDSEPDFSVHPNNSKSPGQWIASYITRVTEHYRSPSIDYAVISHFHIDHMGKINDSAPRSQVGPYRLSGITQVGDLLPIEYLIDRGYPDYNFPVDLIKYRDDIKNYVDFLKYQRDNNGLIPLVFKVGANNQFPLLKTPSAYPQFHVQNVYANGEIWTGGNAETRHLNFDPPLVDKNGDWNGNALSIALTVNYGSFSYFTGGDLTGENNFPDYDIESEIAQVLNPVGAMALNHHGYKDATNNNLMRGLSPRVIVQQAHNNAHVNGEVLGRIRAYGKADLFVSNMSDFYESNASVTSNFKSTSGHVLIRVSPSGDEFMVYILNDNSPEFPAIKAFGPYTTN
ncbi:PKD domain-containing protein [Roseivirga pacifica]|uniref:PKD domain-containing protein n=1 Tax=Roseivirga pacifica TaxID=1267423 RepID=A0A1I0QGW2_9BACT|nr:PKD domain-containing protein [Roseivirga pacifica]RKQ42923.1 PKD domain-containing protein [Roseivirga pacifica]SEW26355.1 PKD domain-containing protein [Roseivirga pacifica]